MAQINHKRVLIGGLVGGVAWIVWSGIVNMVFLAGPYAEAQASSALLAQPRYPFFMVLWFLSLLVLSYILAWLYAGLRGTLGAGPKTALVLGVAVGFAAGFPVNFSLASWAPFARVLPLGWMLDLWLGAVLAAFLAGWFYREA